MLDWIKYLPFSIKYKKAVSEVRGPYFSKPIKRKWLLGDNELMFSAPKSNSIYSLSHSGSKIETVNPKNKNILEGSWETLYPGNERGPESDWLTQLFYFDAWFFVGPWFIGEQARLKVSGILNTAIESSNFYTGNLFHPKVFESAVANFLDITYGYKRSGSGKSAHYRGPLSWKTIPISYCIESVVCDIHCIGNSSKDNPTLLRKVFFPISPTQFVCINFDFGGTEIFNDKIRSEPLFKLCDSIINSITLDVGEATKAEWNKVKATSPDMRITNTFGELPWPIKYEKPSKSRNEFDVTPNQKRLAT
ncbi:hypothetical protein [Saccharophagus degradans]|uniref:Uncharacterized protein n=1 Tax=Saccharophagus degradans (strain 2-40 / ATCC 43961 / DSM 17024) TaxID=203122 RepID=Q21PK5_SACD2|nr:hypothetical protein [Saccharophagus degradans]ABD79374.1 conserved hypothetical protein [Saccharophagus degradans 2-40]